MPTEDSSSTGKLPNQKSSAEDDQLLFQRVASIDRAINGVEGMSGLKERMVAVETTIRHLATKNDVSNVKIWVLVGAGAAGFSLIGAVAAFVVGLLNYIK